MRPLVDGWVSRHIYTDCRLAGCRLAGLYPPTIGCIIPPLRRRLATGMAASDMEGGLATTLRRISQSWGELPTRRDFQRAVRSSPVMESSPPAEAASFDAAISTVPAEPAQSA
jgi:hypothetical protein